MNIEDYMFPTDDELNLIPPVEEITETDLPNSDDNDDDSNDSGDNNPIEVDEEASTYFEYAKINNLIEVPEDFEFDGTPEKLEEAVQLTDQIRNKRVVEQIWKALPEDFKPLLMYGLEGGKSLQDYLSAYAPIDYDNVNLSDPITQKQVIRDYYKVINPNYKEDKIERMINTLERMENTSLEEEAEEAVEYLKGLKEEQKQNLINTAKNQKIQDEKLAEERAAAITNQIESSKLDSLRKNRIKNVLFQPIQKEETVTTEFNYFLQSALKNPDHLIQLADIMADYDPRVGFNFDRLNKRLKTENAKSFKETMQAKLDTRSQVKRGSSVKDTKDDFDLSK